MARDPLEKETDVFNQMNQTTAFNNQMMKDQVASLKSKKTAAPAKAAKKKPVDPKFGRTVNKSAGPMPKVAQKKAPAAPGGSSPYKGNAAPGGSTRAGAARTGGTMRPSGTVAKAATAKPMATKKPTPTGFASSNLAYMLGGDKKTGYSAALAKGAAAAKARPVVKPAAKPVAKPAAKPAAKKPDYSNESNASYMLRSFGSGKKLGYYGMMDKGAAAAKAKPAARTTAGIAGKSAKSVNQLFK